MMPANITVKPSVRLRKCHVSITMPDGSRGQHVGLYSHTIDALNRALEIFPEAKVVSVTASRRVRAGAAV
jgi:hypothetical protein